MRRAARTTCKQASRGDSSHSLGDVKVQLFRDPEPMQRVLSTRLGVRDKCDRTLGLGSASGRGRGTLKEAGSPPPSGKVLIGGILRCRINIA